MTRSNKLRTALVALAISATGVTGLAGVASAAGSVDTKVTIKNPNSQGDFYGKVKSSSPTCVEDRKVTVFKQLGATQAPKSDQKIATDNADANGKWSVGNTGYKSGKFYAKAGKVTGCKAATSKTI
jgi:hypothetical protein